MKDESVDKTRVLFKATVTDAVGETPRSRVISFAADEEFVGAIVSYIASAAAVNVEYRTAEIEESRARAEEIRIRTAEMENLGRRDSEDHKSRMSQRERELSMREEALKAHTKRDS